MIDAFIYGFLISLLVVLIAYQREALNTSGSLCALIVGTLLLGFGGVISYGALLLFFIPASAIHFNDTEEGGRSGTQVLAKSFLPLVFSLLFYFLNNPLWLVFLVASFGGAAADTYSSIFGKRYAATTRILPLFKRVEKGTPGGRSFYGTLAGFTATFLFALYFYMYSGELIHIPLILWSGLLTSFLDSVLNTLRFKHPSLFPKHFIRFGSAYTNLLSNAIAIGVLFGLVAWLL